MTDANKRHRSDGGDPNATDPVEGVRECGGTNSPETDDEWIPDIPVDTVEEVERLTRLAREARDPAAESGYRARRDDLVSGHDYVPRLREEDDTLVLYPDEWVTDGTVRFDRVQDTDRAVEVSLSGPGEAEQYRAVASFNDMVVDAIAASESDEHVENARRFAAFMSNHYVRRVDDVTPDMMAEFREEYYPRNTWPTDDQRAVLDASLDVVMAVAESVGNSCADGGESNAEPRTGDPSTSI